MKSDIRIEKDSMGEVEVPATARYGAQTQRAVNNFTIGSERMPPVFIKALLLIKMAAARVNCSLGYLDEEKTELPPIGTYKQVFDLLISQQPGHLYLFLLVR